ncbi:glycosyl hydrolase [Robiginitalea sp. M366]|uniref:glycosyl hydrolase n=1 Tax=Robiginitalea aestuariiviva TaxID=3036903 RepID=UPI00240E3560|nr:glycosyl hydrolase [Robiginitalea aestuariiviva]MDG1573365.1 glycosyl hydrolase [Robiginitalea aestuariiviva]
MGWNKPIRRAGILLSFLLVNALVLLGIGGVWSYLNTGADRSQLLQDSRSLRLHPQEAVWLDSLAPHPEFKPHHRSEILRDYLTSWAYRNQAMATGSPAWLGDIYTDSAAAKVGAQLRLFRDTGLEVRQVNLSHRLRPLFMSADQTLAVIRDEGAELFRQYLQDGEVVSEEAVYTAQEVVLLLEDGFWRIRNLREVPVPQELATPMQEQEIPEVDLSGVLGVNYYPAAQPWDHFGPAYDPDVNRADLQRIRAMGFTTVRVFFPYAASGGPRPSQAYLGHLEDFLDQARQQDVKVILTLFDFYGDYSLPDWPATLAHARAVSDHVGSHPALLAWDLKNEPDLDFESRGRDRVLAWLGVLSAKLHEWQPGVARTIGWSAPAAAGQMESQVDFISFHFYTEPEGFTDQVQALKARVTKPLMLGEFGRSSYGGVWNLFRGSQQAQAAYVQAVYKDAQNLGVPLLCWTLYDYEEVPRQVVGQLPWRRAPQKHFGLLLPDGTPKAAARVFAPGPKK